MVFLRKSVADFCRARRPECHRSRLIYPLPLSSCYAWSLNFPFLLFFLCFCSQIPPRPPPFTSNFSFAAVSFFQNMIHAAHKPHGFLTPSLLKHSEICHVGQTHCPKCDVQRTRTPENSSEDTSVFAAALFPDPA